MLYHCLATYVRVWITMQVSKRYEAVVSVALTHCACRELPQHHLLSLR